MRENRIVTKQHLQSILKGAQVFAPAMAEYQIKIAKALCGEGSNIFSQRQRHDRRGDVNGSRQRAARVALGERWRYQDSQFLARLLRQASGHEGIGAKWQMIAVLLGYSNRDQNGPASLQVRTDFQYRQFVHQRKASRALSFVRVHSPASIRQKLFTINDSVHVKAPGAAAAANCTPAATFCSAA